MKYANETVRCLHCGHKFTAPPYHDKLGWFCSCPECGGSFDIDRKYLKVGSYTEGTDEAEAIIEREFYRQGYIFKDEEAFTDHYDKPCYVPELTDAVYTKQDFINMCGGREDFAGICFDIVDWQHPESWIEEQFVNSEWDECPACKWFYSRYGELKPCEKCGGALEYEMGLVSRDGIVKVKPNILPIIMFSRQPLGLFYTLENGIYIGLDNCCGDAWSEEFSSLRQCKRWLLNAELTVGGNE